jgi:ligand-binding sensor domain-containing protein/signal transduction histidine kinase
VAGLEWELTPVILVLRTKVNLLAFQCVSLFFCIRRQLYRLALALYFICGLAATSASAQYRFDLLNTDNGLPQNSVYSILQTRDGYMWLTTLDGLVRYDGANLYVFNKANSPGIKSNRFTRLFEDRDGALWICTEDGGLTRYRDGVFTTYTTEQGLPDNWIFNLRQIATGDLLIQTYAGLARWQNGQLSIISTAFNSFDSVLGYAGRSGALWYRLGTTLRHVKDGTTMDYPVPEYSPDDQHYPQLYEDRQGRLWIGSKQPGLLMLKDGVFMKYTVNDGLPPAMVTAFYEDRDGTLWFGTNGGGLVKYQGGQFTTFTVNNGLPSNQIVTIYQDREGTLWVGTNGSGLARVSKQIIAAYSEKEGLPGKSYYPLYEDRAGNIWIGGEGLYRFNKGAFTYYPLNISPDARRSHALYKSVTAFYEDRQGRLWIGSDKDLFSFKDETFTVETDRLSAPLAETVIYAIHQDKRGMMWFGTRDGMIQYQNGERRHYTTDDGLPSNEIHALLKDRQGDLWIGTYGGLAHLANDRFTIYTEGDGLASNRVRALYEDTEGALWIGTYDGGLNRFKAGRFTRYTMSQGLFSNGVFQILEDDAGNFWMSSNQGIYRVSRQQLNDFAAGKISTINSISYGKADGMHNTECNGGQQPAGIRARDGRLWFPTIEGVVVVDPRAVSFNAQSPPVVIERVLLDRHELRFTDAVRINPGQESIEIHYAGLSFIKPEHVRFRYRIEGLDSDWIDAANRRVAFYSHLPAGEYVFRVIAANSDGVWNNEGATFKIIVIPPIWQRLWFISLMGVAAAGTGLLIYRARIQKLKRAQAAHEAFSRQLIASQETERKRIAAALHDSLGQNLLVIKNWVMMANRFLEPESRAREPLAEVASVVSQAIEEVREIAYNLRPYHLDEIGLTEAIRSMLERVGDSSDIRFTVELDSIDDLFSSEGEINLYRVIQESLNNIVKHAQATAAEILIRRDAHMVVIVIKDNGIGFELEQVLSNKDHGFGLTGIAERVRLLGGKESMQSAPGKGTTITLTVEAQGTNDDDSTTHSDR